MTRPLSSRQGCVRRYHCVRMHRLALLLLSFPFVIPAEDSHLDAIRALLLPMRTAGTQNLGARGATPALTTVKHELRDWIESRLSVLQWNGERWNPNPVVLQEQLNDELRSAGLICEWQSKTPCPEWTELGFLGPVVFDMKQGPLIVRTAVGIQECGFDESAYAYESSENQWRRFWQSEQNDYAEGKYFPQRLEQVLISPTDYHPGSDRTEHLILTLGALPWCTSFWHSVYYRVWQTKSTLREPLLLLNGSDLADIGEPIQGNAGPSGVFMEYSAIGEEAVRGPEIRHYVLRQGKLTRADPIALIPADFVAFWLRHAWPESSRWTAEESRSKLEAWRQQHKGPLSERDDRTFHCKLHPDLWQVVTESEYGNQRVYFLIRWRPPYHFTMVSVSGLPSPDCTEEDREADEPRSLFSLQ
jgi:hypothetical protein